MPAMKLYSWSLTRSDPRMNKKERGRYRIVMPEGGRVEGRGLKYQDHKTKYCPSLQLSTHEGREHEGREHWMNTKLGMHTILWSSKSFYHVSTAAPAVKSTTGRRWWRTSWA
jgi:hypothetical protein